jgi:hypothetical protein
VKDPAPLERSAQRGAEAAMLLEHPLFQEMVAAQIEATTQALLAVPVADNDDRLALCTVLKVLRSFKAGLEQIKSSGSFDAAQLARMVKEQKLDA